MSLIAHSTSFSRATAAVLGLVVVSLSAPVQAQDGRYMRGFLGSLGILPEEKEPIEYRERPTLVVPKELDKLRRPEDASAQTANGQWPVDPDAQERAREKARRELPAVFGKGGDGSGGERLSLGELAANRAARGTKMGESAIPRNDKDGVLASVQEMTEGDKRAREPSYPPGTEPPRRYLTDPPTGLRIPSAQAEVGKRTYDNPLQDTFKSDLWKGKQD
jgi:hypothetical protein